MFKFIFFIVFLVHSVFGKSALQIPDKRIVNGQEAANGQFPWSVSLRAANGNHFCTASIINERWVLGAAHCTISRTAVNTFALVGTNSRISGGTNHAIELIINHPDYVNINLAYAYDVCVLRTVVPFTFSSLVTPVPMASEYIDPGRNLITAGWGLTSFQGQLPERLQFMIQTTITNADCSYRLIGTNGESRISPQMVCKLGVPGVGACHGDSGAAVTTTDGYVAGIVSWGIQCAAGYPDVDARVSFFRDWILESIS